MGRFVNVTTKIRNFLKSNSGEIRITNKKIASMDARVPGAVRHALSVTARVAMLIRRPWMSLRAVQHASRVAPVVMTSSTMRICFPMRS